MLLVRFLCAGTLLVVKQQRIFASGKIDFSSRNESSPCTHNIGDRTGQVWQNSTESCTNSRKELRRCCLPIGHHNTKQFLCPIRSQHSLDHLEQWPGESRYPGALPPVLENFGRAFPPGPTDCPWVSEDGGGHVVWKRE